MKYLAVTFTALILSGAWLGCSSESGDSSSSSHGHFHEAPHGGALAMLGDHMAQLELVAGAAPGEWHLYVLDGGAERFVRIEQSEIFATLDGKEAIFRAVANSATGEAIGDTAQFTARVEGLGGEDAFSVFIDEIVVYRQSFKAVEFPYPEGKH